MINLFFFPTAPAFLFSPPLPPSPDRFQALWGKKLFSADLWRWRTHWSHQGSPPAWFRSQRAFISVTEKKNAPRLIYHSNLYLHAGCLFLNIFTATVFQQSCNILIITMTKCCLENADANYCLSVLNEPKESLLLFCLWEKFHKLFSSYFFSWPEVIIVIPAGTFKSGNVAAWILYTSGKWKYILGTCWLIHKAKLERYGYKKLFQKEKGWMHWGTGEASGCGGRVISCCCSSRSQSGCDYLADKLR